MQLIVRIALVLSLGVVFAACDGKWWECTPAGAAATLTLADGRQRPGTCRYCRYHYFASNHGWSPSERPVCVSLGVTIESTEEEYWQVDLATAFAVDESEDQYAVRAQPIDAFRTDYRQLNVDQLDLASGNVGVVANVTLPGELSPTRTPLEGGALQLLAPSEWPTSIGDGMSAGLHAAALALPGGGNLDFSLDLGLSVVQAATAGGEGEGEGEGECAGDPCAHYTDLCANTLTQVDCFCAAACACYCAGDPCEQGNLDSAAALNGSCSYR